VARAKEEGGEAEPGGIKQSLAASLKDQKALRPRPACWQSQGLVALAGAAPQEWALATLGLLQALKH